MSPDPHALHVMLSARFTERAAIAFVADLGRALKAKGANTFMVNADAGDDFGLQTTYGLDHMGVMIALCTKDYGQLADSVHCSFAEVKDASEKHVPIVSIRLCSWEDFKAGMGGKDFDSPHNSGAAQNKRFVCAPAIVALDRFAAYAAGSLDADECAAAIKGILARKGLFDKHPTLLAAAGGGHGGGGGAAPAIGDATQGRRAILTVLVCGEAGDGERSLAHRRAHATVTRIVAEQSSSERAARYFDRQELAHQRAQSGRREGG